MSGNLEPPHHEEESRTPRPGSASNDRREGDPPRPSPIHPGTPLRSVRWLAGWIRTVLDPGRVARPRDAAATRVLRWGTLLLVAAGLAFAFATAKAARIRFHYPLPLHFLVVASICAFAAIGFWMLCGAATRRLGWFFCTAAFLGSTIYVAASFADLALQRSWPGGVAAAWVPDLLFMPSIAVLLPPFLALIPSGRPHDAALSRWITRCAFTAGALLFLSMAFESHPFEHPRLHSPLARLAPARPLFLSLGIAGLVALASALLLAGVAIRRRSQAANYDEWHALKWYEYGGLAAGMALVPYLIVLLLPSEHFSKAETYLRAWGAGMVAMLALMAIPASVRERWHHGRIKRLVLSALIASVAAGIHGVVVDRVVKRLSEHPHSEASLTGGVFLAYGITLLVAVAVEPGVRVFHRILEKLSSRARPFGELLEDLEEDLRLAHRRLYRQIDRRMRQFAGTRGASTPSGQGKSLDVEQIMTDLHREEAVAEVLVEKILSGMREEWDGIARLISELEDQVGGILGGVPGPDGKNGDGPVAAARPGAGRSRDGVVTS